MSEFDYISSPDFRKSLETDHAELEASLQARAWKGVHVLSGSIVEALLIDYLTTISQFQASGKDPLKLDLGDAVKLCSEYKVISTRAAELCSVVRSYRNLIHPGRVVRLNEAHPDESSAKIAVELVRIIAREIAERRTAAVGPTAEQILTKIKTDIRALSILKHLLPETTTAQQLRLLDMIPDVHRALDLDESPEESATADRLASAFRTILTAQSPEVVTKYVDKFAKLLREADGFTIAAYGNAFVRPEDIGKASPQNRDIVSDFLLEKVRQPFTKDEAEYFSQLLPQLRPYEAKKWLDPMIQTYISNWDGAAKDEVKRVISRATILTSAVDVDKALEKRMEDWVRHFTKNGESANLSAVQELKQVLVDIPF